MKKYFKLSSVLFIILLISVIIGIFISADKNTKFWASFFPGLFSNIIGISIAAALGIPIGLESNRRHILETQNEQKKQLISHFIQEIDNLITEVESHAASLQSIGQVFPANPSGLSSLIPIATLQTYKPKEREGERFLSNRCAFDLGQGRLLHSCGMYYDSIASIIRFIDARLELMQQTTSNIQFPTSIQPTDTSSLTQPLVNLQLQLSVIDNQIHVENNSAWVKNSEILRDLREAKEALRKEFNI